MAARWCEVRKTECPCPEACGSDQLGAVDCEAEAAPSQCQGTGTLPPREDDDLGGAACEGCQDCRPKTDEYVGDQMDRWTLVGGAR